MSYVKSFQKRGLRVCLVFLSWLSRCKPDAKKGFRVQRADPDQEWSVATPGEGPEKEEEEEAEEIGYL